MSEQVRGDVAATVEDEIRPWVPSDRDEVTDLILRIQRDEFGVPITLDDQPDLLDVAGFYQASGGGFWVARAEGAVVGTIAAVAIGDGQVALRKMFVAPSRRGTGIAARLMDTLLTWVRHEGVTAVWLGTTAVMEAAHRFYEKHGFERVPVEDLPPSFPLMTVDSVFYRRAL